MTAAKRFRFRLETVLRVRRVQEEQARARVMVANRAVALAALEVDDRAERYAALPRPAGVQTYREAEAALFRLDAGAGAVEWARGEHAQAVEHAQEELARWARTEQRVRALERLHDRAREEHATEVRRAEDRLTDELTTTRARLDGATA
jgi:flagellar biosynthesis chaperone FliJ